MKPITLFFLSLTTLILPLSQAVREQRLLVKRTILLFMFHLTMPWHTPTGPERGCRLN